MATTFSYSLRLVPIFDGEQYDYWSSQMKTLFISQDLWEIIENGYEELPPLESSSSWTDAQKKQYKENKKKDATALWFIRQGLSKSIFPIIFGLYKAKAAWEILQKEFQDSEKVISAELLTLWREFDNIVMFVNQIRSCGDTMQEKKMVIKILRSFLPTFEHVVSAIEESKNLEQAFQSKSHFSEKKEGPCMSTQEELQDLWHVDSGCSNHMTRNKSSFVCLDEGVKSKVKIGDGKYIRLEGKGDIAIQKKSGNSEILHDVFYAPESSYNLLSVGQLLRTGYMLKFDEEECEIVDKKRSQITIKVKMTSNNVFPVNIAENGSFALNTEDSDDYVLWHLRYGHLSYKGLGLLKQKEMVIGLPPINIENESSEGCVYGNMHRLPFPKTSWGAKAPLELVHADIWGPFGEPSLNNKRYFLILVDDFSRMLWVYIIQQKSEAFSKFLEFMAYAERECGYQIKFLRTYCAGEFIYKPFLNHCIQKGIKRQLEILQSPRENGVAEKEKRTIAEMVRSMLKGKSLPDSFWEAAVNTAVYILNRSPTEEVSNMTPYEACFQQKPKVDHLRVFGCMAYSQISSQDTEKMDEKGEKYIFIGYNDESNGYQLYNPDTKKQIISREVFFDEFAAWEWSSVGVQEQGRFEEVETRREKPDVSTPPASPHTPPTGRISTPSSSNSSS